MPGSRHLLFDFGGPVLLTPFELTDQGAAGLGVDRHELSGGPFDPNDLRWRARQAGEITEREYWSGEGEKFGLDIVGYLAPFYEPSGDHLVRPESVECADAVTTSHRRTESPPHFIPVPSDGPTLILVGSDPADL